jgi:hypothetical protein
MKANQATLPIATMARLLKVSASGYYAWIVRRPSKHARSDADLLGASEPYMQARAARMGCRASMRSFLSKAYM